LTNNPIYCAIDTSDIDKAILLIEQIAPYVGGVKLGLEFFTAHGPEGINKIKEIGLPIFLDLKLYDIPNTVKKSLSNILSFSPEYTTVHISGGSEMLNECVKLKKEMNSSTNLIGVTMLTSFNDNSINEIGLKSTVTENVKNLSTLANKCGLDGIVCAPLEIDMVKKKYGNKLKLIVPGIREVHDDANDQKRTLTAKEAFNTGADVIVVGRPIIESNSPADAAAAIQKSLK
jgi:orotidine-5'-phosphate decarboxylase